MANTMATTAATTAAIVPIIGSRAVESAPIPTDAPEKTEIKLPIAETITPIAEINLPIMTITGPTVAASKTNFTIAFCIPGDKLFHLSLRSFKPLATCFKTGSNTVINEFPTSAPTSFKLFIVVLKLSIGSSVASNVCSTFPKFSCREVPNCSKDNDPFLHA